MSHTHTYFIVQFNCFQTQISFKPDFSVLKRISCQVSCQCHLSCYFILCIYDNKKKILPVNKDNLVKSPSCLFGLSSFINLYEMVKMRQLLCDRESMIYCC